MTRLAEFVKIDLSTTDAIAYRLSLFKRNLAFITTLQQNVGGIKFNPNIFSLMTPEEKQKFLGDNDS
jgi:hypothetical protein